MTTNDNDSEEVGKVWGVKCLTKIGWYGQFHPYAYTHKEALRIAQELNSKNDGDKWEARMVK